MKTKKSETLFDAWWDSFPRERYTYSYEHAKEGWNECLQQITAEIDELAERIESAAKVYDNMRPLEIFRELRQLSDKFKNGEKKGKIMIDLGTEVRDSVSGFTGIAIAKHSYLNGCNRITVQPVIDKQGKLPEAQSFDEPQLSVVSKKKISLANIV